MHIEQPRDMDPAEDELSPDLSPEEMALDEEEMKRQEAERAARLDGLCQTLFDYRKDAITARDQSGIEQEWADAQNAYEGYDNVNQRNRDVRRGGWASKPVGQIARSEALTGSTVYLNITRPYVDASAARVADMLFPTDDRPWGLKATPIPELSDATESKALVNLPDGGQATEGDLAKKILELAEKKAERAQTRIADWLTECQWHAEGRKVVEDAARIGVGILKGPVPVRKRKARIDFDPQGQMRMTVEEKISPVSMRIKPWNFWPDGTCGQDIHDGSYCWERDDITGKALRELKGTPGYIDSQIDAVLEEGPQLPTAETAKFAPRDTIGRRPFDIWYFTGTIERDDMEAAGCDCSEMQDDYIDAVVTMVNNRVIKAARNPLDSGEFPYDVMCWQMAEDHWAGMGVGHQISVPQRGINAGTRNMMDNAAVSAGSQIVMLDGVVEPVDGVMRIGSNKLWKARADADIQDVRNAFITFQIPSRQVELLAIIQFYLKMAEDVTGMPMLLQGQQGKAPETVGGMTMLQNNASGVLRRMARLFDDCITEPHVGRFYDWLMQHGENPEEKGDFTIDARASSVLVERDLQNQAIIQLVSASLNPNYGADPRKCFAEACKAQKLDPERFQHTEEEWKQIQESQQNQPADFRVMIEQMRITYEEARLNWQADQNERDRAVTVGVEELRAQLKDAELQGHQTINVTSLRGKLADTVIKTKAQERMSDKTNTVKQISKPPTEPAGRAKPGQAYQA